MKRFNFSVSKSGTVCDKPVDEIEEWRHVGASSASRPLLQCLPEGETMPKLGGIVQKLTTERDRAQMQVDRLNAALAALDSVGNRSGRSEKSRVANRRRPMSAAARKRIAAAQRARWAKWKAAHRNK